MKKYLAAFLIVLSSCKKEVAVDGPPIDMTPIKAEGKIFFISRRIFNSSDWQMFTMNADGTDQKLLTNSIVLCEPPVLSHNGKKIAFTTYGASTVNYFSVIDIDGQNEKVLSGGKEYFGTPAWSSDDSRIAFVGFDRPDGHYNIYSIKADGSDQIKLTSQDDNWSPQFSTDNRSVIFTSYNGIWWGIYKMNLDGSNKQLLTPQGKSFANPRISPDGSKIAITSIDWDGSQIFVMNADGSNLKQITFTVSPIYFDSGYPRDANGNPVWSPNGEKLAYVSWENASPDVFVINSNGSGNKRLTNTPRRDECPTWSNDGNYIIFTSTRTTDSIGRNEIFIMRSEGQLQTGLTGFAGQNNYPAFIK
jgi:TolB protein